MLLLIVMSNTAFFLWAADYGPSGWHPIEGSMVDRIVQFLVITMLDLRVYPLFAFLFGYGMMQLFLRQTAAGTSERAAAGLLRRRSLWLIVFGFVHAALLMAGDIIGSYGLAGLVLGWLFLRRANRTLLVWSGVAVALIVVTTAPAIGALLGGDLGRLGTPAAEPTTVRYAAGEPDLLAAAATRLGTWSFVTLGGALLSFTAHAVILLGFWAARRRILEEPHQHLRLLRWTAAVGLTIGWLGGLPAALAQVGVLDVPPAAVSEDGVFGLLQNGTGIAAGLGYVAVFGLVAHRLAQRPRHGHAVLAVAAVGKRSLSCYLTHSLIFAPVLAAWGLGLGAQLTSATMALFAIGVWLVTVCGAYALERKGWRGPAEVALRHLTYRQNR